MIPAIGLLLGIAAGLMFDVQVPLTLQPYLPIAVVAALDAVFGGVRAVMDGVFDDKVFVISFVSNVLIAAFIVFLGDQLGVGAQLSTAVIVVLGIRIFTNVANIRRHVFHA
ncbi:MAG TPA: small basic family protein [Jiangellales bacterium]|nr:small basic family protein [Jiangellales bacterium]